MNKPKILLLLALLNATQVKPSELFSSAISWLRGNGVQTQASDGDNPAAPESPRLSRQESLTPQNNQDKSTFDSTNLPQLDPEAIKEAEESKEVEASKKMWGSFAEQARNDHKKDSPVVVKDPESQKTSPQQKQKKAKLFCSNKQECEYFEEYEDTKDSRRAQQQLRDATWE